MAVPFQFSRSARAGSSTAPSMFGTSSGGGGGSLASLVGLGGSSDSGSGADETYSYDETPEAMLNAITRMLRSGDKRLVAQARTSLKNNRHRFTEEMLKQAGVDSGEDHRNLFEQAVGGGLGFLGTVGEIVSRPQQTVAHGLNTVGTVLGGLGLAAQGKVDLGDVGGQLVHDAAGTWRAAHDISGKSDINTREMLNLDKNAGGSGWFGDYVVGGLDLAGQMVTDPLAFVGTAGGVEGTKAGLRAAEELGQATGRPGLARLIEKEGASALREGDQEAILGILREKSATAGSGMRGRWVTKLPGVDEGAKTIGPVRRFKDAALADTAGRKGAMEGLSGTERAAERNLDFLLARGQKGLKFGGETIVSRDAIRSPLEKIGVLGKETRVATSGSVSHGVGAVARAADAYNEARGAAPIKDIGKSIARSPEEGRRVADAYARMASGVSPEARASYEAFAKESADQFAYLTKPVEEGGLGIKVEYVDSDAVYYKDNTDLMKDMVENKHLYVNKTTPDQAHPFLSAEANDQFRATHDAFGHAMAGPDFSRHGEEAAWLYHGQMYSEDALPALATETRGQNSYLNYSKESEALRAEGKDAAFGEQKAGLLPGDMRAMPDLTEAPTLAERGVAGDQLVTMRGKSRIPGASRLHDIVAEAFVPGAGVARTEGEGTLDAMKAARETTHGTQTAIAKDNEARIINTLNDAMKEDKNFRNEMETIVYPAMERTGQAVEHADAPAARAAVEDAVAEVTRLREEALAARRNIERMGADTSPAARFGAQQREAELAERIAEAERKVTELDATATGLPASTTSGAEELAAKYEAAGRTKAAAAVRELDAIRTEDTQRLLEAGLISPDQLHDTQTYMRRQMTKQANKAMKEIEKNRRVGLGAFDPNELQQEMSAGGSLKARGVNPDMPLDELNPQMSEHLGIEGPAYKMNPFTSVGTHTNEVSRAVAEKNYLDEVSKLTASDGRPLLSTEEIPGYTAIPTKAGTYYAPKEIAKEVQRFQALVVNDDALKGFERGMDRVMKIWKAYATVPLIGAAFHMRNLQTNVMLNWVAGMGARDLHYYADAFGMQRRFGKASELIGKPIEGSAGRATHTIETAMKQAGMSEREIQRLKWAREDNVLGSSYFQNDIAGGGMTDIERQTATRYQRAKAGVAPGNLDNWAIRSGRAFGGNVEDNARLAHYLWSLDHGGDRAGAAMSVKKYLFNYEDLTNFEKTKMKRIMPFYTFARKNTALMVRSMAENPGKFSRFAMAERETRDNDNPLLKGVSIPGYIAEEGQAQRKGPLSHLPITSSIESPFSAAGDTLAPAVQLAAQAPGLDRLLPDELKNREGGKGVALDLLNLPGGPPAEFAKRVAERATGVDTFTGAPINDRKLTNFEHALNWADVFAPAPSKIDTLFENAQGGRQRGKEGANTQMTRLAALVKLATGINATSYDERSTRSTNIGRYRELADAIEAYNTAYPDDRVPTLTELREAGKIPQAPSRSGGGGSGLNALVGLGG